MKKQMNAVRDFHKHIRAEVAHRPCLLNHCEESAREFATAVRELCDRFTNHPEGRSGLMARTLMSLEETAEWLEAHAELDINAAADAWGDRAYILFGDAVATGIPVEQIFDIVHESNMTKSAANPMTGKAVKGGGYVRPRIDLPDREI